MSTLFLALALSVDAFGLGISFGMGKIKIPLYAMVIISLIGIVISEFAAFAGNMIFNMLPVNCVSGISGTMLIFMGLWIIKQGTAYIKDGKKNCISITVNIVRTPQYGDLDSSKVIDTKEAVFLGAALSLDSAAACVGWGDTVFLPIMIIIFQMIFIIWGNILGRKIIPEANTKICTLLSGTLITFIGIFRLFC